MTNDQIKALIREVIAEGIDLDIDIPDEEIARVVTTETASLVQRIAALEKAGKGGEPKATETAKPSRVDVLKEGLAKLKARKAEKEAAK